MIASLWKAPSVMLQHAGLYVTIWVLGLATSLVAIAGEAGLIEWIGGGVFLNPSQPIDWTNFLIGGLVFMFSTAVTFFLYGLITRQIEKKQTVSVGFIAGQSILLSLLIAVAGSGLIVLVRMILSLVPGAGILSLIALVFSFFIGLILFVALIKFVFTAVLFGHGLRVKDALAESWKQTSGHFWALVILLIVVNIISSLIQSIEVFLPVIGNEWINLAISITLAALATFYSLVVTSIALPSKDGIHSAGSRRHGHLK